MNVKDMSNEELLEEYNSIREKIEGIVKWFKLEDLNRIEELVREMTLREEV